MKLVDANVLLYAVNEDADRHEPSRRWLDAALSGQDTVAFAWSALLAFVRLATKEGLFPSPLTLDAAMDRVDGCRSAPPAVAGEHRCTIVSFDHDFDRFEGVDREAPDG